MASQVGGGLRLATVSNFVIQGSASNDVILFASTSNQNFVFGASNNSNMLLRISSNGNIGVGLSNPGFRMDVAGDLNFSGTLRQGGLPYVGSQWSNNISNVFLLGSNVGIGTAAPTSLLHLGSSYASNVIITLCNLATGGMPARLGLSNTGDVLMGTGSNHGIVFVTSNVERMRVNSNGFIGIGTSNPACHLDVAGDANVGGTFRLTTSNTVPAAPVAYYAFNTASPLADSVGAYTLAVTGAYSGVPGVSGGNAIYLVNPNSAVAPLNFVRYAAGITNAPPLSVSCWFNTTVVPANNAPIFAVGGSTSGNAGVSIRFNSSLQLQMATYTNAANQYQALSTVSTNTWYHVATTMSTSNITVYLNGAQIYQTANLGTITTFLSGNQFALGGCTGDALGGMTGFIDEVRVYNRVLAPAEVTSLAGLVTISASPSNAAFHSATAGTLSTGSATAGTLSVSSYFSMPMYYGVSNIFNTGHSASNASWDIYLAGIINGNVQNTTGDFSFGSVSGPTTWTVPYNGLYEINATLYEGTQVQCGSSDNNNNFQLRIKKNGSSVTYYGWNLISQNTSATINAPGQATSIVQLVTTDTLSIDFVAPGYYFWAKWNKGLNAYPATPKWPTLSVRLLNQT